MKDIQVIGSSYTNGSYQLLRESADRVRAALYFADLCSKEANENNIKLARWYYRATLSEFKSIFEVLCSDFKRMKINKIWQKSEFKNQFDSNPLIKILNKARDLAIHTVMLPGSHIAITVQFIDQNGERPVEQNCIFFDEIDRTMFKEKASYISDAELKWFNKQAKQWPVNLLVREAIYQSSVPIANFLTTNHKHIYV